MAYSTDICFQNWGGGAAGGTPCQSGPSRGKFWKSGEGGVTWQLDLCQGTPPNTWPGGVLHGKLQYGHWQIYKASIFNRTKYAVKKKEIENGYDQSHLTYDWKEHNPFLKVIQQTDDHFHKEIGWCSKPFFFKYHPKIITVEFCLKPQPLFQNEGLLEIVTPDK